jgi:hypothetical protein
MRCSCTTLPIADCARYEACRSFLTGRSHILELISTRKLYGMRAAYDEVMTTGIKRRP